MEIARLFADDKSKDNNSSSSGGSIEKSPVAEFMPEMAGSFLLCKEEVPLSPLPVSQNENEEIQPSTSQPSNAKNNINLKLACPSDSNPKTADDQRTVSPPTTPESLRHGALLCLTPPRDQQDCNQHQKSQLNSSSASDLENGDIRKEEALSSGVQKQAESPEQHSEDSREKHEDKRGKDNRNDSISSPKRKRRGRVRTPSTSEAKGL